MRNLSCREKPKHLSTHPVMLSNAKHLSLSTHFKIFHYVQNDTDAHTVMLSEAEASLPFRTTCHAEQSEASKHATCHAEQREASLLYAQLVMLSKAKYLTLSHVSRFFTTFKMTQTRMLSCLIQHCAACHLTMAGRAMCINYSSVFFSLYFEMIAERLNCGSS